MARLDALPETRIIKGMKGKVDFYLWKGLPVARKWPRKTTIPKTAAELDAALEFGAISASYKETDPITRAALLGLVSGTQQRELDAYIGLSLGARVTLTGWTFKPATSENRVMHIDLVTAIPDAELTWVINSVAYTRIAPRAFYIPFEITTYNRYRITGWGRSNAAGQTIDLQIQYDTAPFDPVGDGAADINMNNTEGFRDSGDRTIASPPSTNQRCALAIKGSNATVDASFRMLRIDFWQA